MMLIKDFGCSLFAHKYKKRSLLEPNIWAKFRYPRTIGSSSGVLLRDLRRFCVLRFSLYKYIIGIYTNQISVNIRHALMTLICTNITRVRSMIGCQLYRLWYDCTHNAHVPFAALTTPGHCGASVVLQKNNSQSSYQQMAQIIYN